MKRLMRILTLVLAVVMLAAGMTSCRARDRRVVGECGGYEVLYEEVRYEAKTYLQAHPNASGEELRAAVARAVCERYAVLALCAERIPDVRFDSKELKELTDADIDQIIDEMGGRSEYKKALAEIHANDHFFRHLLKIILMQAELEEAVFAGTKLESEKTLLDWWKAGNCVRVTRVAFDDRASAEAVKSALDAGKTLEELVGGELLAGSNIDPHYYYFRDLRGSGEETAALALAAKGAYTDVVESADGFYILIREADDFETLIYQTSAAINEYRNTEITKLIAEKADTLTLEWNKRGAKLDLCNLK